MNIPVESMSIAEKLDAMEQLWASLDGVAPTDRMPAWHAQVLTSMVDQAAPDVISAFKTLPRLPHGVTSRYRHDRSSQRYTISDCQRVTINAAEKLVNNPVRHSLTYHANGFV